MVTYGNGNYFLYSELKNFFSVKQQQRTISSDLNGPKIEFFVCLV